MMNIISICRYARLERGYREFIDLRRGKRKRAGKKVMAHSFREIARNVSRHTVCDYVENARNPRAQYHKQAPENNLAYVLPHNHLFEYVA
jgi:hypothetical protein